MYMVNNIFCTIWLCKRDTGNTSYWIGASKTFGICNKRVHSRKYILRFCWSEWNVLLFLNLPELQLVQNKREYVEYNQIPFGWARNRIAYLCVMNCPLIGPFACLIYGGIYLYIYIYICLIYGGIHIYMPNKWWYIYI